MFETILSSNLNLQSMLICFFTSIILGPFSIVGFRGILCNSRKITSIFFVMIIVLITVTEYIKFGFITTVFIEFLLYIFSRISFGIYRKWETLLKIILLKELEKG